MSSVSMRSSYASFASSDSPLEPALESESDSDSSSRAIPKTFRKSLRGSARRRGSARSAQRLRRERVRLAEAHGVDAAHALRAPKRQRRSAETVSRASFLRFESIARVERKLGRVAEVRVPDGGDHRASALASRDGDRLRVVRGSEPGDTERPQVRVSGEPTPNRAVARARERDVGAGGDFRRDRFRKRGKKKRFSNASRNFSRRRAGASGRPARTGTPRQRRRARECVVSTPRRRRRRAKAASARQPPWATTRTVRSFVRSGSVRSARRRGFGATTKERLEHRGRLGDDTGDP